MAPFNFRAETFRRSSVVATQERRRPVISYVLTLFVPTTRRTAKEGTDHERDRGRTESACPAAGVASTDVCKDCWSIVTALVHCGRLRRGVRPVEARRRH